MGATKSVLRTCYVEDSKGTRKCGRNKKHPITKGDRCLVFKESMKSPKSYCVPCARIILERGQEDLARLIAEL